ncbi:MAG: LysM peptidoglycan-binding domain-containing protein [Actinomycetia bacterium]|nr:LysM peptidoglycan-binding domain-containing protein [Actinomycetes bacterium]MCP4963311.1 LysM peptidoglycan-binding domain-containing protein [Actinomycetes bacterium]
MKRLLLLLLFTTSLTLVACGSSDSDTQSPPTSQPIPLTTAPTALTTTTTTTPPGPKFYEIQPGDVLSSVASAFGLTLQQVLDANPNISDPGRISVGQQILIPEIDNTVSTTTDAPLELDATTEPTLPELRDTTTTTEPDATTTTASS